ncbi:hypothetical protein HNY73_001434 [Argiope bruennichi]|uniref:Uncharacterized protein n=1 Tax=Argiope bruennichi TaxID=94029 RepID=A0A8T0G1P5_ARGBR|nr:hypothetical protein HNY73_001434 [Argiope bruennichi]
MAHLSTMGTDGVGNIKLSFGQSRSNIPRCRGRPALELDGSNSAGGWSRFPLNAPMIAPLQQQVSVGQAFAEIYCSPSLGL